MTNKTKYGKLMSAVEYDHEAAEQLADAMNEVRRLEQAANQLRQIIDDNPELKQYVWTTAKGESIALQNIEDDHLVNIMQHILEHGGTISRSIRGEAIRRDLVVPVDSPIESHMKKLLNAFEGDILPTSFRGGF